MVNQNVGDVIQVTMKGVWHGQMVQNILKYGVASITGAPSTSTFAAGLQTALIGAGGLYAKFLACCPPQYNLGYVDIQTIAPLRVVASTFNPTMAGTYGQDSSTANLAAVITKYGDFANRRNIGSIHIPTANLDPEMSNGSISNALTTALIALAPLIASDISMSGLGSVTPVLLRAKGTTAQAIPIQSCQIRLTVRTMRRRTVGVGK